MAITARLLRSLLPAVVSAGLVLAACSSDSDEPSDPGQVDDPKPTGGSDSGSNGGAAGAETTPGDAGTPPVGTGGTDVVGPGTGGAAAGADPGPEAGGTPTSNGGEGPGPDEPTEGFLAGKELVEKFACASCHQADMGGFQFYPNISPDDVDGIGTWTDEQISDAVRGGKDTDGSSLCSLMVPQPALTDDEMADMTEYLRGIPGVKRAITAACPVP